MIKIGRESMELTETEKERWKRDVEVKINLNRFLPSKRTFSFVIILF